VFAGLGHEHYGTVWAGLERSRAATIKLTHYPLRFVMACVY
jgi:hypothetical protein